MQPPSSAPAQQKPEVFPNSPLSQAPQHEKDIHISPELSPEEVERAKRAIESGPEHMRGVEFVGGDIHEFVLAHVHAAGNEARQNEIATWVDYEIAAVAGVHTTALAETNIQSALVDLYKNKISDTSHKKDGIIRDAVMAAIDLEYHIAAHPDTPVTIESIKALIPKQAIDPTTKGLIRSLAIACTQRSNHPAH